jgi:PKD repeat protein
MQITHARTNDSLRRSLARRAGLLGWLPVAAAIALSGCTVKKTETPDPTGPSELGLSLELRVSPDVVVMDGVSQSTLTITSRDSNGKIQPNVGVRVELTNGGAIDDTVGRLSTKNVTTGGDGKATVTYTAPNTPANRLSDTGNMGVTLVATPAGYDARSSFTRQIDIRLVPQGTVLPQAYAPVAQFSISPATPGEGQDVLLDASSSIISCIPDPSDPNNPAKCRENGGTAMYQWDFGNGQTGSGVRQTIRYATAGTYIVTLVVTNDRGLNSSPAQKNIQVGQISAPNAEFSFSPSSPAVGQQVFYDANASHANGGRTITNYSWNFGDGHFGSDDPRGPAVLPRRDGVHGAGRPDDRQVRVELRRQSDRRGRPDRPRVRGGGHLHRDADRDRQRRRDGPGDAAHLGPAVRRTGGQARPWARRHASKS